jgi:hypothetical protein
MDNTMNQDIKTQTEGDITLTDDSAYAQAIQQPPKPNPDLNSLDALVGTWKLSGELMDMLPQVDGRLLHDARGRYCPKRA